MIKKKLIIVTFFTIFLLITLNSKAEEIWNIKKFKKLSYASVSGEITHGDTLNFYILAKDSCSKVWNTFSFYTYEKPKDIQKLKNKNISIELNGVKINSVVQTVNPFLMGYRVTFSLGVFPVDQYVDYIKQIYDKFNKFEIKILDEGEFKASKYFDIRINNWKLSNLIPSIEKAKQICLNIDS